jgi:hypothetical protein
MLMLLAIFFGLIWIFGFVVFHVVSSAGHLFLLGAIVAAAAYFVHRSRTRTA